VRSQLKEIESAMLELETAVASLNPLSAAQTDSVQLDEAPDTARTDSMQVDEAPETALIDSMQVDGAPETARIDSMQVDGAPTRTLVKTDDAELCEPCERPQAGVSAGVGAGVGAQMDSRRFTFRIDDITHEQVGSNTRQHADCL
jgi:hypothetical protein